MASCSMLMHRMDQIYDRLVQSAQHLSSLAALGARLWVAQIFWNAGVVKWQSMSSTITLFRYMYHVPLLPPVWAAYLGTGIELAFPVLLALGMAGRFAAAFLFIYNILTIISYPQMGWTGVLFQVPWGIFLLYLTIYGPGVLSVDAVINKVWKTSR
ncbi:DoxX family protein [Acidithiobacillus sp. CV18-2]|uniref:DoxX family protein n=1 Tax=Igneacidithiobacillus copahuensis TaxID=2724909 RepID=A0AAE3CJP9_9PROT|nr:DoxX family protein [Igneacidithiobacillus copahuensis]MBU2753567.1 DoxX family protein [Acidithiobacillus sp. CV18-3]MBU2757360.1 DoxX family protein [Acidithiobacillus sp. BN09-2]MBU2776061.1 DoxX family protein [Acidithiobacillus sp. CV18-2]MBU2795352.1 DoxX family protein [Acidithiobacillus sp. VAN18-2]MBU2800262.1 DoxX family protein [Acidithiobacillus sp. VAN18-4]UTV79790.1 DoxX family protein [Acidithiobacillus sp. YTS05]